MKAHQAQTFMMAKIATSLLTAHHAKLMQLQAYDLEEVKSGLPELLPQKPGFKIPYFTLDGQLRKDGFYRYRIDTAWRPDKGFASVAVPVKPQRYAQIAGSGSAAYFSPTLTITNWRAVAGNPAVPVCITEGELKSACCCSIGVPTIGLGGVNNFRTSMMSRSEMLPELEEFLWEDRAVVLLFDTDLDTNSSVRAAASLLASVLTVHGAQVALTHPPTGGDPAQKGVDDWLYRLPACKDKLKELTQLLKESSPVEGSSAIHAMNLELARVCATRDYVELSTGRRMKKAELLEESEYGARLHPVTRGDGEKKMVPTAKEWLTWRYCRCLKAYTHRPGEPRITADGKYNLWTGWPLEDADHPGDVGPFLWLLDKLVPEAKARRWLEQWLAAPVQTPGLKINSAVLLWGLETGTGKTRLADTMHSIYGAAYGIMQGQDFHSDFNSYLVGKQFILGDEISTEDRKSVGAQLKTMVTRALLPVNEKFQVPYLTEDHVNYYFTSNDAQAVKLSRRDRRFFIYEVADTKMTPRQADDYTLWLKNSGPSHLFHYLRTMDLSGFDPYADPPMTDSKVEMIHAGMNEVQRWIEDLKANPELITKRSGHLHTVAQLVKDYKRTTERTNMEARWMGQELTEAGVKKAAGGSSSIKVGGLPTRVHIVGATPEMEAAYIKMRPGEVQKLMELNLEASPKGKFEAAQQRRKVQ